MTSQDPETVEIMVNADGRIWQEKLGQKIQHIGNIQTAQVEAVIKTVAGVNQHAKIARERLESTLKSFHLIDEKIRHLVGEPWSDNNGAYSRNQAPTFH